MKPDPLLDAVFSPGEESLRPVLKAARRRRVRRVAVRVAGAAACLAAVVWFTMPRTETRSPITVGTTADSTPFASPAPGHRAPGVPAPPRPDNLQFTTGKFSRIQTITTQPLNPSDIAHTRHDSALLISTADSASTLPKVGDADLLAYFEPGRAALVGDGFERRLVEY